MVPTTIVLLLWAVAHVPSSNAEEAWRVSDGMAEPQVQPHLGASAGLVQHGAHTRRLQAKWDPKNACSDTASEWLA